MGCRTAATESPASRARSTIQRDVCDLPQPVRTAQTAITGRDDRSMVRLGASIENAAPAASAREARCMTSACARSL